MVENIVEFTRQFREALREDAALGTSRNPDDVQFQLFIHQNEKNIVSMMAFADDDALENTPFAASKTTKVLIHGLDTHDYSQPLLHLKDVYLLRKHGKDNNVIIVNWRSLSARFQLSVLRRINTVGKRVGDFLLWLAKSEKIKLDLRNVHIVGISEGAHVAGLAANTVNGANDTNDAKLRVARITALDPASPRGFISMFSRKLRSNDADFVDAYYNSVVARSRHLVGQVNFFVTSPINSGAVYTLSHTVVAGPEETDVTDQATVSRGNYDPNIDGRLILGEYCLSGSRGKHHITYDDTKQLNIDNI